MSEATTYEIEIRGRVGERFLQPVVDDFQVETTDLGNTRIVGAIRDSSHLNGILAHFASFNIDIVSVAPSSTELNIQPDTPPNNQPHINKEAP